MMKTKRWETTWRRRRRRRRSASIRHRKVSISSFNIQLEHSVLNVKMRINVQQTQLPRTSMLMYEAVFLFILQLVLWTRRCDHKPTFSHVHRVKTQTDGPSVLRALTLGRAANTASLYIRFHQHRVARPGHLFLCRCGVSHAGTLVFKSQSKNYAPPLLLPRPSSVSSGLTSHRRIFDFVHESMIVCFLFLKQITMEVIPG